MTDLFIFFEKAGAASLTNNCRLRALLTVDTTLPAQDLNQQHSSQRDTSYPTSPPQTEAYMKLKTFNLKNPW